MLAKLLIASCLVSGGQTGSCHAAQTAGHQQGLQGQALPRSLDPAGGKEGAGGGAEGRHVGRGWRVGEQVPHSEKRAPNRAPPLMCQAGPPSRGV